MNNVKKKERQITTENGRICFAKFVLNSPGAIRFVFTNQQNQSSLLLRFSLLFHSELRRLQARHDIRVDASLMREAARGRGDRLERFWERSLEIE